ncbi:MAG: integrase core domain-containing protein, partial [Corynebacterium casei]|uniref:integrase core domain-containing protein n=1 Tax=Corynebacterium casei TaxID=160386 RepID=UPI003F8D926B
ESAGVIHHSDAGVQGGFNRWAENHDVRLSVGEVGVCWDNAVAESFFSTLKLHLLYERKQFVSKLEARISVGEWIEAYYNRRRIHTSTEEIPKKAMDDFLTTPVTTAAQAA